MRYHPPIYMYCVFHHIYDRDVDNIFSKKFSRYDEVSDDKENHEQSASKSLTPHRMNIAQIDRWCISSPKMYDMLQAKVDRLAGKMGLENNT